MATKDYGDKPRRPSGGQVELAKSQGKKPRTPEQIAKDMGVHPSQQKGRKK